MKMKRKIAAVFIAFVLVFSTTVFRLAYISGGSELRQAALQHSSNQLMLQKTRGQIYDHQMRPLLYLTGHKKAVVTPSSQAAQYLTSVLPREQMQEILTRLNSGKPFVLDWPYEDKGGDGVQVFDIRERYNENQLASVLLGYLDSTGEHGVSGIEKAYNDYLNEQEGSLSLSYPVDAMGRTLGGVGPEVTDTRENSNAGVVLTLDRRLQSIVTGVATRTMEAGCVVILEVPTGKIRAMVSVPDFTPLRLQESLKQPNAPLINRALCSYNLGSIFKLVDVAAGLENGYPIEESYTCTGSIHIVDRDFNCHEHSGHGAVTLQEAIEQSCNPYFIQMAQRLGAQAVYDMAQKCGFGKKLTLCDGIASQSGILPTLTTLKQPAALANFSFGQGELMVTPLQVAAFINAICSNGEYRKPTLIEGLCDKYLNLVQTPKEQAATNVFSKNTAQIMEQLMISVVENGSGRKAKPDSCRAGGKTATAETGWVRDGRSVVQTWFAGFFPADNPQYVAVVLSEDGEGGSVTTGPIFKEIVDKIMADG